MLQTKKTKRENKRKKFITLFFILFYSVLILLITSFVIYSHFIQKKTSFLSPISQRTYGIDLEGLLGKDGIDFVSIDKKDGYSIVNLKGGREVLLSDTGDMEKQVSSLQLVLNRLKIEGKDFKRLDLRFKTPVIVF